MFCQGRPTQKSGTHSTRSTDVRRVATNAVSITCETTDRGLRPLGSAARNAKPQNHIAHHKRKELNHADPIGECQADPGSIRAPSAHHGQQCSAAEKQPCIDTNKSEGQLVRIRLERQRRPFSNCSRISSHRLASNQLNARDAQNQHMDGLPTSKTKANPIPRYLKSMIRLQSDLRKNMARKSCVRPKARIVPG